MIYYIYFTANMVGAGEYENKDKKNASLEIHKMIREKTTEKFGCLISDKINFVEEVENCEDVDAYIQGLIKQISIKGEDNHV